MKNNKGITLIALVITIIVLLILAGVAVSTLFGQNGLITKAQEAPKKQTIAAFADRFSTESAAVLSIYLVSARDDQATTTYVDGLNKAIDEAAKSAGIASLTDKPVFAKKTSSPIGVQLGSNTKIKAGGVTYGTLEVLQDNYNVTFTADNSK